MSFTIRRARASDAPFFPGIELSSGEAFRSVPGLEWVANDTVISVEDATRRIASGSTWVAMDPDGTPRGFLSAERYGEELHIWQASVAAAMQRVGIGRALFARAIEEARDSGLAALTLSTFRDVPWNAPFYQTLGFEIVEPGDVSARLRDILVVEAARGLPAERRCAMRLKLQLA